MLDFLGLCLWQHYQFFALEMFSLKTFFKEVQGKAIPLQALTGT
jgi:hypothetical protein